VSSSLAAETRGTGEPVVFLHGWALNLAVWRDCARALESRYQSISIDLPGHGGSSWMPELPTFDQQTERIDASLPGGQLSLVGWSLGGLFAMALAARFPGRIRRLVLIATTPRFVTTADWPSGLSIETVRKFASELATNYRRTVNDFLELQTRGSANATGTLSELRGALEARGDATPEALHEDLGILEHSDLRRLLPSVAARTLIVSGQYDRITPPPAMTGLAAGIPRAEFFTVARAGHAPFLSHSAIFLDEVTRFLDDHD